MVDLRSLLLLVLAGLTLPATLHATPGATEINQASVEASGGFPIVISAPGNYVLTSDLIVPSNTSAISLTAHHVVIDLNGFRIAGPHPCGVAGCTTGSVTGISGQEGQGRYSTVRGGTITGFSGTCIALGQDAFVDEMYVSRCGRNGVQVSQGSLVRATRVRDTGRQGIRLVGAESGYVHNVVVGSGWAVDPASVEAEGIDGGIALGGNACSTGHCSPERQFYLTQVSVQGDFGINNGCASGYHVATSYELLPVGSLAFNHRLGGPGPVFDSNAGFGGWITDENPNSGSTTCFSYSISNPGQTGRVLSFTNGDNFPLIVAPAQCDESHHVWCVED
jgi:hypothetical protein